MTAPLSPFHDFFPNKTKQVGAKKKENRSCFVVLSIGDCSFFAVTFGVRMPTSFRTSDVLPQNHENRIAPCPKAIQFSI